MKTITVIALSLLATAMQMPVSKSIVNSAGMGFVTALFLVFGTLIILFQLMPAFILYSGMIRSLFPSAGKKRPDSF